MRFWVFLCFLCSSIVLYSQSLRIVSWNVENYFDIYNDSLTNDDSFTPMGDHYWTSHRFACKRNNLYKVIVSLGNDDANYPAIVGLCEVENDYVLRELCYDTPLRKINYKFIHYDSPDKRGIDCALLYRPDRFKPFYSQAINVSDSSQNLFTRDILLVAGIADSKDTCYFLVNHFPSKLGGAVAEYNREKVAKQLKYTMDTIQQHHPSTIIVAMGDFNASSSESIFTDVFLFKDGKNMQGFYDLGYDVPEGVGTYKYQSQWSCLDHIITNCKVPFHIYSPDFLLIPDKTHMGYKVNRTYVYVRYQGGISDHFPIYIDLSLE